MADADYVGLAESTQSCAFELIESSQRALDSLSRGKTIRQALTELVDAIDSFLATDGLPGWIACRCGVAHPTLHTFELHVGRGNQYVSRANGPFEELHLGLA